MALWAVQRRSWGIACAGSRRFARIVRLVQRREGRLCLPARPRVASLALGRRLVVWCGVRLARALGLTGVLGLAVRERRRLEAARVLVAASMATRCVASLGGSAAQLVRAYAGRARR